MKAEATKMAKMTLIQYHHMGTSTTRTEAGGWLLLSGAVLEEMLYFSMR